MRVAVRGALAVALLVGLYVLGLAVVALALGCVYLAVREPNIATFKIVVLVGLAAAATMRGLWAGLRARPDTSAVGQLAIRGDEPTIWHEVETLAVRVGTRAPDTIRFIPAVNAAVVEETRWLGLRPGARTMFVGLPLLQGLTVSEARSVLAHELGHFSGRHTSTGPVIYRGHVALVNVIRHLRGRRFTQRVFVGYAKLFFRVSGAVSRRQELEADAAAAEIAGRDAAISALSRLPALDAAWTFYLQTYVAPTLECDVVPDGLLHGFGALLADPERRAEMAAVGVPDSPPGAYDTHPPIAQRVAALRQRPSGGEPDDRPATVWIARLADVDQALPAVLLRSVPRSVGWDQAAGAVGAAAATAAGEALLAAAREAGVADRTIGSILHAVERGQGRAVAAFLSPKAEPDDQVRAFGWAFTQLALADLSRAGRLRWSVSWSGTPWRPDIDVGALRAAVEAAVWGTGDADVVRRLLRNYGVDAD